jgi:type VI protein secretion system component VasF
MATLPTATNQSVAQLYADATRLARDIAALSTAPRSPFAQLNRPKLVAQATTLLGEVMRIGALTTNPAKERIDAAIVAVITALKDIDTINLPARNSLTAPGVSNRIDKAIRALVLVV